MEKNSPMEIPSALRTVLDSVRQVGRPRIVGGGVRDWLLGLKPKDFDLEVAGVDFDTLQRTLAPFGATDIVGRSFGVIKLRTAAGEHDFSLPRRESKTGAGHRGFAVEPEPQLSEAEAAARRDFTINAIAYDPFDQTLIDPHGGQKDLQRRVLRHTSNAFTEDPLRVLRGFQLAARFDLTLAPETITLCRSITSAFSELAVERVWAEWDKWAIQSVKPSRGIEVLLATDWLQHFPEVAALHGTPQDPEWHPEGDALAHTQYCLDALVKLPAWQNASPAHRRQLTFAVLAHDFGKPATTEKGERRGELRWISPGHEAAGAPLTDAFLNRLGAPLNLKDHVRPLVQFHLYHHHGEPPFSDSSIRRLARKLAPSSINDLCLVMRADHDGRPPLHSADTLNRIKELEAKARELELQNNAPKPIILGRHLLNLGYAPSPKFKPILTTAFEAQLDGAFGDESSGVTWLQKHLREHPRDLS